MSVPTPEAPEANHRTATSHASSVADVSERSAKAIGIAVGIVCAVGALLLFAGLSKLGIWDPHELTLADLGCRKAAASGRFDLASCGVETVARTADVRPAVMVQSVAWGFRVFGITEIAGRVPLALWILVAAAAITLAVSRLVDARAGAFAGLVTVTTPMALVQGRLMLGDAATMGAFAVALAGFSVAAFDREDPAESVERARTIRSVAFAFGLVGVALGIGCRGLAVGGAPALAVGLAALVRAANTSRASDPRAPLTTVVGAALLAGAGLASIKLADGLLDTPQNYLGRMWLVPAAAAIVGGVAMAAVGGESDVRIRRAMTGAALAMGGVAVFAGIAVALSTVTDGHFVASVGATSAAPRKFPTFDLLVRQVAHGAFPWSALLPLAAGRVFAKSSTSGLPAVARETDLRIAALVALTLVFMIQTLVAPRFGLTPFVGVVALAVLVAVVLRDVERAPSASLAIILGTAVIAGLILNDYNFEDLSKTPVDLATAPLLEAYGIYGVAAPDDLRLKLKYAVAAAGVVFLLPVLFVWVDGEPTPGWTRFAAALRPIRAVRAAWKHPYQSLWLLLAGSFEVCIAIVGWVTYKRSLRTRFPQLQAMSLIERRIVGNLWWLIPVAVGVGWVVFVAFLYGRDLFRALKGWRVSTVAVGGLVAAATWSFFVMPAVASQFSPKNVFAVYRQVGQGAPVALLGVSSRTAAFELDTVKPASFNDARTAYDWLTRADAPRKFLALRAEHLPELNKLFREKSEPRINLPILDGRTSQVLLASNFNGGTSENPLDRFVMSALPTGTGNCTDPAAPVCAPARLLDCDLDGKLRCLGWDLLDDKGQKADGVRSNQHVRLRLFYKVTAHVSGGWQIFTHIEQPGTATARRTNDHVPLGGKYAMDEWLPGDIIVDDSEFDLEPSMKSGMPITILTGFFQGNSRMPLVSGPDAGPETEGMRLVLGSYPVH